MKKKGKTYLLIAQIICIFMCISLVFLNMLSFKFTHWLAIIPCVILIGVSIYNLKKYKILGKLIIIFTTIISVSFCILTSFLNPYWNSDILRLTIKKSSYSQVLTYNQAKQDLNELMGYLETRHPLFIDGLSKEVIQQYNKALTTLQNLNKITSIDLQREIQLILAPIGDAHTTTYAGAYSDNLYLKDIIYMKKDGWDCVKVNKMKIDEYKQNVKKYICYEVDDYLSIDFASFADYKLYNQFNDGVTFEYENSSGQTLVKTYTFKDFVPWDEFKKAQTECFPPQEKYNDNFVYYTIDEDKSLALLTLKSCKYNAQYIDCVNEMFAQVKEKGIKNVAVDLRDNSGGSSLVANEIFSYMPINTFDTGAFDWRLGNFSLHIDGNTKNKIKKDLLYNGKLYILINNASFSSAKDFAMMVADNNLGTLIGEPPANSCSGFGEATEFHLENTGMFFQVSTKKWYRIDKNNSDLLVRPDIVCQSDKVLEELHNQVLSKNNH